ncbi:MAG TPA: glycosyltransferase family A protein [Pyrinomonadaceae bacterium]|jgi:glycosyltransferase involved in cell wall biosynthesis|nr:glycosyltransferase family A protein [Pyrinomonadaceae bacterium]
MAPLLSVVIPTWNRAHVVCEAVESALIQREGRVEVLVVDDGSTDGTAELIARRFGPRVRLLRMTERAGVGAARNAGVRAAGGELIAFLDSDDVWLPGKLDAELRAFAQFPEASAVVSDSLSFNEGVADSRSRFESSGLLAASKGSTRPMRECRWLWTNSENGVATCSITLRRGALARVGRAPFAEDLASCEDWEFEMRLYHLCEVVVLPEVWAHVRRFDDGARVGRAAPGRRRTREQEMGLLRDRLTVVNRSQWLDGLDARLADELERFREDTARRLACLAESGR